MISSSNSISTGRKFFVYFIDKDGKEHNFLLAQSKSAPAPFFNTGVLDSSVIPLTESEYYLFRRGGVAMVRSRGTVRDSILEYIEGSAEIKRDEFLGWENTPAPQVKLPIDLEIDPNWQPPVNRTRYSVDFEWKKRYPVSISNIPVELDYKPRAIDLMKKNFAGMIVGESYVVKGYYGGNIRMIADAVCSLFLDFPILVRWRGTDVVVTRTE